MIGWLVVGAVSAAAWLWLLLGHGWFWRADQRLPPLARPVRWPSVAIVVPARNEAELLPATLPTLLAQRYPGPARVILVDDNSTDGTADVARRIAWAADGLSLTVTTPGAPSSGWTGKLWALAHGVRQAGEVEYLLFTDADIAHPPSSLTCLVAGAAAGRELVSWLAVLRADTRWERLVVPAFVYFFGMLFPFRWVNRSDGRTAAAAGGCVLVDRAVLARAGGLAVIRGEVIDDVALARMVKRAGGRIWLGLADQVRSVRPYPRLTDLWHMVSRSAYPQLRRSPLLLVSTVLGMAVVFLAPPVVTVAGLVTTDPVRLLVGGFAWLAMAATYVPTLRYYRQPMAFAVVLPGIALLYTLMTLDSARRHWSGHATAWKGRRYGS